VQQLDVYVDDVAEVAGDRALGGSQLMALNTSVR